jgi:hypothetical protein
MQIVGDIGIEPMWKLNNTNETKRKRLNNKPLPLSKRISRKTTLLIASKVVRQKRF